MEDTRQVQEHKVQVLATMFRHKSPNGTLLPYLWNLDIVYKSIDKDDRIKRKVTSLPSLKPIPTFIPHQSAWGNRKGLVHFLPLSSFVSVQSFLTYLSHMSIYSTSPHSLPITPISPTLSFSGL